MEKSADAFRTISEVADDLVLPQHVLRFWETRFPQIRPLKRAGGRRYYRPVDVILLRSIRQLLYDEGYTIKGVQRLLKEQGARGLRVGDSSQTAAIAGELDPPFGAPAESEVDEFTAPAPATADEAGTQIFDREELREALACIEDCERILRALRHTDG